ncbi:hypothetical protein EDB83DRAFT_2312970 [Lactarius deliciosus]|nr:hypothetical protein EDB83DRAFT_2312970 [Lactarius deliciosus]
MDASVPIWCQIPNCLVSLAQLKKAWPHELKRTRIEKITDSQISFHERKASSAATNTHMRDVLSVQEPAARMTYNLVPELGFPRSAVGVCQWRPTQREYRTSAQGLSRTQRRKIHRRVYPAKNPEQCLGAGAGFQKRHIVDLIFIPACSPRKSVSRHQKLPHYSTQYPPGLSRIAVNVEDDPLQMSSVASKSRATDHVFHSDIAGGVAGCVVCTPYFDAPLNRVKTTFKAPNQIMNTIDTQACTQVTFVQASIYAFTGNMPHAPGRRYRYAKTLEF